MNNWTDELLNLMVDKMVDRKKREADAYSGDGKVSLESLAANSRGSIKIVKK